MNERVSRPVLIPPITGMKTRAVKNLPIGKEWMYEPKWNGFRCLVFRDHENIFLQSKPGKSLTSAFPEIVVAFRALSHVTAFNKSSFRPDAPHGEGNLLKFHGTPLFPERVASIVPYRLSDAEAQLYTEVTGYVRDEFNRAEALANASGSLSATGNRRVE